MEGLEERVNPTPSVSVASLGDITEGGSASAFRFTRSDNTTSFSVSVNQTGSAIAMSDYSSMPMIMFSSGGALTVDVSVTPVDDSNIEGTETITFTINASGSYSGTGSATMNLFDNDTPQVTVSKIADAAENGSAGTFRISRTGPTTSSLGVTFTTGGTATSGTDYTSIGTGATIASGNSYVDVTVSALADNVVESGGETVTIAITDGGSSYSANGANASLTIADDPPVVSISGSGATEGASGAFTVTRTGGKLADALTVSYSVSGGTATSDSDFTALSGSVVIGAGKSSVDVTLAALADNLVEGDETVEVTISSGGTDYTIGTATATATITDDPPVISVAVANTIEGSGTPGYVRFFRTGGKIADALSLSLTIGGTATNSTDYTSISGSASIAGGKTSVDVNVVALPDNIVEAGNETVTMKITPTGTYVLDGAATSITGVVTINDDPPIVTLSAISDATEDGSDGAIRFTRSGGDTASALTVSYAIGGDAISAVDYEELSGTITIPANTTSADVCIVAVDDNDDESLESLALTVEDTSTYLAGSPASELISIADNDLSTVEVIAIANAADNFAKGVARFSRTLGELATSLTIDYTISGTATAGTHYAALSGSITIPAWSSEADVDVTPILNSLSGTAKSVVITIDSDASYLVGGSDEATIWIRDEASGGISGHVFYDDNGDGVQDLVEYDYGYSHVFLMKGTVCLADTFANASGDYSFSGLAADNYTVLFQMAEDITPTLSATGQHNVTVAQGVVTSGVDEGCQPPANATPTGNRDGIQWGTLDFSTGVPADGPGGNNLPKVRGMKYNVKTVSGSTVSVFEANPAATQPAALQGLNLVIGYNCHGYTMNTRGVIDAKGGEHDFSVIDSNSASTILGDEYNKRTVVQAAADLSNGKTVIMVFATMNGTPIHSVKITTLVADANGNPDADKSFCDSKDGFNQLRQNKSVRTIWNAYAADPVPANRPDRYGLFVLK